MATAAIACIEERRADIRSSGVVDRAVITFRGRDYAVPVVEISARGTMIESDIVARLGESLIVRFENCSGMYGFVRWAKEGRLGIRFGHEIVLAA